MATFYLIIAAVALGTLLGKIERAVDRYNSSDPSSRWRDDADDDAYVDDGWGGRTSRYDRHD